MASTALPSVLDNGTHAARPAATAVAGGTLYACSDHDLIYQSDTATWSTWADLTGSGTATSVAFCGARVFNSADISLTAGVDTALTFNSERYDSDAFHDTGSNTSRLTVPTGKGGKYHISGTVSFTASATAWSGLWIRLNGTTKIAQTRGHIEDGSNVMSLTVDTDYALAQTDYVELMAFSSAGTRSALVLANYSPEFMLFLAGV